jgi:hypothetical protein
MCVSEPREAVCEWCGKRKPDVQMCDDPFQADVYQESYPVDICGDCYQDRADQV